jgi:hypothetical protein
MKMRRALAALWVLCVAVGVVPEAAMALSPAPPQRVFCTPGSSLVAPSKDNDKVLQSAAENFWRRITPGRLKVRAWVNLPEPSESSLALSTACAYAVKERLVELGLRSDRIDVDIRVYHWLPQVMSRAHGRRHRIE